MNPFKVSKDSWHYKLLYKAYAEKYGYRRNLTDVMPKNFCAYWRAIMFTISQIVFLATLILGFIAMLITGLVNAIAADPMATLIGAALIILFFATIFGILVLIKYLINRHEQSVLYKLDRAERGIVEPEVQNGLLVTKYKAWKSKICPSVEYEK